MNVHSRGRLGAGYLGADQRWVEQRPMNFLGKEVTLVSTTHERAHIMSSIALAPRDERSLRAALVWEGLLGKLYLVDDRGVVFREVEAHDSPGTRWALLFALADPAFLDEEAYPQDTSRESSWPWRPTVTLTTSIRRSRGWWSAC